MKRNSQKRIRQFGRLALIAAVGLSSAGCSLDALLGSDELPPDVTDPAITHTAAGARAVFNGALLNFRYAFAGNIDPRFGYGGGSSSVVGLSGLLSDELHASSANAPEDMHVLPGGTAIPAGEGAYSRLQRTRAQSGQAIALLQRYDPENRTAIAHAYAIQGYAEVFLAEFFCSGIPLSTLDFDGDFTYRPGSPTDEVLAAAIAHFDSAVALAGDSVRVRNLAQLGRARALLGLGRFGEAAASVQDVPDDFAYRFTFPVSASAKDQAFTRAAGTGSNPWAFMVADGKGLNGLDFVASGDPRTRVTSLGVNADRAGLPIYFPDKYPRDGSGSFVVASGIEARLTEAEAALRAGDSARWLSLLNALRANHASTIEPPVTEPLPELTDPGTDETRVDLHFRERAFWLFLTGQRQGDMRRLVRHYGRAVDRLYPIGEFPGPSGLSYGGDIDVPIPATELLANPHFNGCLARGE